jgi:hypothetical protein
MLKANMAAVDALTAQNWRYRLFSGAVPIRGDVAALSHL